MDAAPFGKLVGNETDNGFLPGLFEFKNTAQGYFHGNTFSSELVAQV